MAKSISISTDDSTYYVFPGSTGDLNLDGESLMDTIFGQKYQSSETGLFTWTSSADAVWKGVAGYVTTIKKSGTSTSMTSEACTEISGTVFQVTDTAKQVLDRTASFSATASVTGALTISSIDYLYGKFTFAEDVTGETVTVNGNYLPMAAYGKAQEFTLTQSAENVDNTDFDTAQGNGGYRTFTPGLRQVSLDLSGFYATSNGFKALLQDRSEVVIEISPDGAGASMCRGFFKPMTTGQSGDVGGNETETVTFELSVPYSSTQTVDAFTWEHSGSSSIPVAVQTALTAWEGDSSVYIKYLHDGTNGYKGSAVITDFSLSAGLSSMSTFSGSFAGSGALTAVP